MWIRAQAVASRIASRVKLMDTVHRVQSVCSAGDVTAIVRSTPEEWLSRADQPYVVEFLTGRLERLDELVKEKSEQALPRMSA
jgi:hypothetical protein